MTEPVDKPAPDAPDADAWATACEEDLRAEKARRAASDPRPANPLEELLKLADTVAERVAGIGGLAGTGAGSVAQGAARQFVAQARAAVEPVVERNPQVFDHLAAAGNELLGAYRAAVQGSERRWSAPRAEDVRLEKDEPRDDDGPSGSGPQRIDLD